MPLAAVIVNRTRVAGLPGFRQACRYAATASGWQLEILETTVDDRGVGLARDAVAGGASLVIAAGGDGTARACAQALAGTQVPLAIIPLGTANLAARALGVPRRAVSALAVAFGGRERRIDLALAELGDGAAGLTFAAMAGIGLDAEVVAATPHLLKRRGGWAAYAATGVAHLAGRPTGFTIALDGGEPLVWRARSVVVGNGGLLPGGFTLLPAARLDDGLLDVGILAPAGLADWLRVARRVLAGGGPDDRRLARFQARRVEIHAERVLAREADGEVVAPGRRLTVTLLPQALIVRVP
ncbi:MAG TPA: diacylglycerol kinase family protein [Streptosporangiaceae bacterium]